MINVEGREIGEWMKTREEEALVVARRSLGTLEELVGRLVRLGPESIDGERMWILWNIVGERCWLMTTKGEKLKKMWLRE